MLSLGLLLFGTVTVELPAEAKVQGAEMTLDQIAVITGDDPAEVERVGGLALGYAPSPGYSRLIQRWKLIDSVTRQFADVEVDILGEDACRVRPETATVTGHELRRKAQEALEGLFEGEDFQLRGVSDLDDETVPKGVLGLELRAEPAQAAINGGDNRPGSWSVPVQILVDGMPYRTVWSSFEVDLYRMLPVLTRDVAKGQKILRGDVALKRTAVRTAAGFSHLSELELAGATANRPLKKDDPVGERDVTRAKAIVKGETIDLAVENGSILVNTKAIALQDGYVGDVVNVQVVASGKQISATVDRRSHVRLTLDPSN